MTLLLSFSLALFLQIPVRFPSTGSWMHPPPWNISSFNLSDHSSPQCPQPSPATWSCPWVLVNHLSSTSLTNRPQQTLKEALPRLPHRVKPFSMSHSHSTAMHWESSVHLPAPKTFLVSTWFPSLFREYHPGPLNLSSVWHPGTLHWSPCFYSFPAA